MEQLNNPLPLQEEKNPAAEAVILKKESPLLLQVRQNFGLYGAISLTFGGAFALLFYKAWIGLNVLLYAAIIVGLLIFVMTKLTSKIKSGTKLYFTAVILLGISTMLTSNGIVQFLNIVGILILLDLSLLHQFYEVGRWDFAKHLIKMFGMVFSSIACIWMPFVDSINYFKKTKVLKNDKVRNITIGIIIAIPILFIITALLSGADILFGSVTENIYNTVFSADIFWIITMILFGLLACYCILCASVSKVRIEDVKSYQKADATIAATVMTLLCLVYACFCVLQVIYLFAGGLFSLPESYTFAEYARRGFFELMWVTAINIGLMILCRSLFKESKYLSLLVVIMTICTGIMIASATYRMILYISVYHLTFLRLFVLMILLIEVFVLAGVIISEYKKNFPLFTFSVAVVTACYIIFSLGKPDLWIAAYLVDQKENLTVDDLFYVTSDLSLDAAGVVLPLIEDEKRWNNEGEKLDDVTAYESDRIYNSSYEYMIKNYYARIKKAKGGADIRDYNYSNSNANQLAKEYPMK